MYMKRLTTILSLFFCLTAAAQTVDITEYTANAMLQDTLPCTMDSTERILSAYPSITETYQIPAYDLYSQYWDVTHIRSRILDIPFSQDRLTILLVQETNNPFEPPCTFNEILLPYGQTKKGGFHPGIDLKVECQTLVRSCFDGVVRMARKYGPYGLMVVVRHYNGLETVYAHLGRLCVKQGQMVNAGDVIGQTGQTGNATECVLHFETRFLNEHFNPENAIDFADGSLTGNTLSLSVADFRILPLDETKADKALAVSPQQAPKQEPEKEPATGNPSEIEYHIVQKGETLYRIAVKHNTTTDKIQTLNNITVPSKIIEGQRLRIK